MLTDEASNSLEKMADWPIGVFDSGMGGLTLVNELKRLLPRESIVYFGDTANLPYGEKSKERIQDYARQITHFLLKKPCKVIVMACHTASAVAYQTVFDEYGHQVPIFNVVDPVIEALQYAALDNPEMSCGLIGTHRTIDSGIYPKKLKEADLNIRLQSFPTPLLVPVIEFSTEVDVLDLVLSQYLDSPEALSCDTLIMGCTHYPLIQDRLEFFYENRGKHVNLINPSLICAVKVADFLRAQSGLNPSSHVAPIQVYLSDRSPWFVGGVTRWLSVWGHQLIGGRVLEAAEAN